MFSRLDEHMREIVNEASIALVIKICGAGLSFGFNVLLARMLGAEGAGIYYLALTLTTIATVFGRMGLDNTMLRFIATNCSTENWVAVKGIYRKGMLIAFFASTVSTALLFLLAPWLADTVFSKPDLEGPIRWMAFAVVPMTFVMLHGESLKGLKKIRDSQLVQVMVVPALSLIGLLVLGEKYGVQGAVLAYSFAAVLSALLACIIWRNLTPQLKAVKGCFDRRELLRSSMPLLCISIMNIGMTWTATFILGIWGTKADVGIFGVASRTAMLTSFILVAVNSIAAPKFAELYKKGDMEALGTTAINSAKLMTVIASPLLIIFLVAPELVMGVFGKEFKSGATLLFILAIGQFVNVATGSVGPLLMMTGNELLLRNSVILGALSSVLLSALFIFYMGLIGAALANATSLVLINIYCLLVIKKRFGICMIPSI